MLAEYLFVYGTLKQEAPDNNHHYMEPYTEFFGFASSPGKLYLYEDSSFIYPCFDYDEQAQSIVRGELYVITDAEALFEVLDTYEGCTQDNPKPHQYRREHVTVKSNVAFEYQAWTYVYNWPTEGLKELQDGTFI